jgi:hypothetical protein
MCCDVKRSVYCRLGVRRLLCPTVGTPPAGPAAGVIAQDSDRSRGQQQQQQQVLLSQAQTQALPHFVGGGSGRLMGSSAVDVVPVLVGRGGGEDGGRLGARVPLSPSVGLTYRRPAASALPATPPVGVAAPSALSPPPPLDGHAGGFRGSSRQYQPRSAQRMLPGPVAFAATGAAAGVGGISGGGDRRGVGGGRSSLPNFVVASNLPAASGVGGAVAGIGARLPAGGVASILGGQLGFGGTALGGGGVDAQVR